MKSSDSDSDFTAALKEVFAPIGKLFGIKTKKGARRAVASPAGTVGMWLQGPWAGVRRACRALRVRAAWNGPPSLAPPCTPADKDKGSRAPSTPPPPAGAAEPAAPADMGNACCTPPYQFPKQEGVVPRQVSRLTPHRRGRGGGGGWSAKRRQILPFPPGSGTQLSPGWPWLTFVMGRGIVACGIGRLAGLGFASSGRRGGGPDPSPSRRRCW